MAHALSRRFLVTIALSLAAAIPVHAGAPVLPQVASGDLGTVAPGLAAAAHLRVVDVAVPATSETIALDLERFEVFTADADIIVHGAAGSEGHLPRPKTVYFKGNVAGEPGSRVFLETQPGGHVRGYVNRGEDEMYLVDSEQEAAPAPGQRGRLAAERADNALLKAGREQSNWSCEQDALPPAPQPFTDLDLASGTVAAAPVAADVAKAGFSHTARVAIETDYEFYQKFNNTAAATAYIGNVIGYASAAVYQPEIATSLMVSSVSLWTTSADPWAQTGTLCGLMEFGRYWNKNKTGVSRTIAHFMSGKANGGGVAWLGVLCSAGFSTSANCPGLATDAPWGGGYGYTGNLIGNFNINNPQVVWDLTAVAHEIGHNFSSPHSHCYGGIGGASLPSIDGCYNGEAGNTGCYAGANALPGPSSLAGGAAGGHTGTIMSYCHLLSGGMANLTFTFGGKAGFNYGVSPARESQRMSGYVASFGTNACLAPVSAGLLASGFEAGLGGWSGKGP